jgi:phosphoribosyl-ATP pyrophosphohydrolase/phosphoribosyl-AMP cyclohydrolase
VNQTPDFSKGDGLLPAIAIDHISGEVLMLGYQNQEAWELTSQERYLIFYSRSKQRLWKKGETSGNVLQVESYTLDCDYDTLLYRVIPAGPTCHTGARTCFGNDAQSIYGFLHHLENVIAQRLTNTSHANSYVRSLQEKGIARMAQKVGEEGLETALEAVQGNKEKMLEEAADLIFHLLVLLKAQNLNLSDVIKVLENRHQK